MEQSQLNIYQENIQVTCSDGVELKGVLFVPQKAKAVLQFNGGTATKKEFYFPFLNYLAQHGYLCCAWDYRGSGESAPPDLSSCDYRCQDYGIKDMPAIKDFLNNRFPDLPFLLFGHSVGGQQVGFMKNLHGIKGMLSVAVSTGYLSDMPLGYRISSNYFFFLFTPVSIMLTGYLKAKRFGIMEDLPKGVVKEWRDWCMKKDYFFDPKFYGKTVPLGNFKKFDFPIHLFWAEDDTIANKKNTQSFWKHIQSTHPIEFTKLVPKELGLKSIGHFGFFKRRMKDLLWPEALKKLDAFLE